MRKLLVSILIGVAVTGNAQNDGPSQSAHFVINPFLINPAFSAADDLWDSQMGYRQQWAGINGGPRSLYVTSHAVIGKPHPAETHPGDYHNYSGVGLAVYQHQIGPISEVSYQANYSYSIQLTSGRGFNTYHEEGIRLSMGAFVGMKRLSFDRNELTRQSSLSGESTTGVVDVDIAVSNQQVPDASFGMLLYLRDKIYFGITSAQLFANKLNFSDASSLNRHYYVVAKHKFEAADKHYFTTSMVTKLVSGAPASINLGVQYDYHDLFFGGVSFRGGNSGGEWSRSNMDAIQLYAGTLIEFKEQIKHFRYGRHRYGMEIYYSYELGTSRLGSASNGSHEITVGFRLPPMYKQRSATEGSFNNDARRRSKSKN